MLRHANSANLHGTTLFRVPNVQPGVVLHAFCPLPHCELISGSRIILLAISLPLCIQTLFAGFLPIDPRRHLCPATMCQLHPLSCFASSKVGQALLSTLQLQNTLATSSTREAYSLSSSNRSLPHCLHFHRICLTTLPRAGLDPLFFLCSVL